MTITANTIDHSTLEHLVEAGAVRGASIIGQPGGWSVVVQYGAVERALAAKRGAVRVFRKFETLVAYLLGLGISAYRVDASAYDAAAPKAGRADAAQRMTRAHEAAAYNEWLKKEVQEAIDDPTPSFTHEEAMALMDAEVKALKLAHGLPA